MTDMTDVTIMIEMIIVKGMKQMDEKERREHEELIAVLTRIADILRKMENDLFWMVHADER